MGPNAPARRHNLPLSVQSRADINKLVRELDNLDSFFLSSGIRKGTAAAQPPRLTRLLSELAKENQLNLLEAEDRGELKDYLKEIMQSSPNLHISFASDPAPKVTERILEWFRGNIHPEALIVVGLQPDIAAGMVLRTPNKIFDMSMRSYLENQQPYLIKLIEEVARG